MVEPVNLPPVMIDDIMGSVDDIVFLSDVKVACSIRNEVNKELNMWVETKEEVDKYDLRQRRRWIQLFYHLS